MSEDRVIIFDSTLRDGEQAAGGAMSFEEKLEIARHLERLGADIIEAGFPISSPGDFQAVQTVSREIKGSTVCALARALPADIDQAWEAIKEAQRPRIHTFLSASDIHIEHQLKVDRERALEMAIDSVKRAKGYCEDVEFSPMDATRADPEYLYRMIEATIDAGATTVNIPDTVGYGIPSEFAALIQGIQETVPNIHKAVISVHCHNDLGMAVANSLAAVKAGARQVECCINGIGERAGNASFEEVVMSIHTRKDFFGITTGINTQHLYAASRMVSRITGFTVQPNKPIVGSNAFRHSSGIHMDGVLKERVNYEIMDPPMVGWVGDSLVLGPRSGRHGLRARLETLGYHVEGEDLERVYEAFIALADKKQEVTDLDLESLMAQDRRTAWEPSIYRLEHVQVSAGSSSIPTATVELVGPDEAVLTDAAIGNGPVDAIYQAINRIVGVENRLVDYNVSSVTEGLDAIGEVTIRIERNGHIYLGHGANTDILVASAKAYLSALNRLIDSEGLKGTPRQPGSTPD
jgi:2-isopropylmalate synthase